MILHTMKIVRKKTLTTEARRLDIVVLAVYLLEGDRKSVDTEDIAVKSHELAPGMFSWQKYPGQINLRLVHVTLFDARKPKYGSLLTGSHTEGWRLSSAGLDWANSRGRELLTGGLKWNQESRKSGSVDTKRKQREKKRLKTSLAWESWNNGAPISVRDARDLFRIDAYSTRKMLEIKVVRLQSLFTDDVDISRFLKDAGDLVLEMGNE